MKVWDNLNVGDDIIPDGMFDDFFYTDFSDPLTDIFGTNSGRHQNDGDFKLGPILHSWQSYASSPDYPDASNQRNLETQHYTHPHGSNPNPLDLYGKRNGHLVATSRLPTESEKAWAKVKGYYLRPDTGRDDGGQADAAWFEANYPGGVPQDWAPSGGGGILEFRNMPAREISPMFSTLGRRAMSFGRFACRIKMPTGASGNTPGNLRDTLTTFPAFWLLQDVIAQHDLNGDFLGPGLGDTHTPGNQAANGKLPELDPLELFGYERNAIHQTLHVYEDGHTNSAGNPAQKQINKPNAEIPDVTEWMEIGCDITPGKIFFWVNGKITNVEDTPASIASPLLRYVPRQDLPYLPQINADKTVKTDGIQEHGDGSPKYMNWFAIWNIAHSAKFTRYLAKQAIINSPASVPPRFDVNEMEIEWIAMRPLAVDNPDQHRTVDYKNGTAIEPILGGVGSGGSGGSEGGGSTSTTITVSRPGTGRVVAGTSTNLAGRSLYLDMKNGNGYSVPVNASGDWTYTVPSSNDDQDGMQASVYGQAVDGTTDTERFDYIIGESGSSQPTAITVSTPGTDRVIAGTSTNLAGRQLYLDMKNGNGYGVPVDASGSWSYTVPSSNDGQEGKEVSVYGQAADGTADTERFDYVIGSSGSQTSITVNTRGTNRVVAGISTNLAGRQLYLDMKNGNGYGVPVDASGGWSYTVPSSNDGQDGVEVSVYGQAANGTADTERFTYTL